MSRKVHKTLRLRGYDYSKDNLYFITTCVRNRACCFGEIVRLTNQNCLRRASPELSSQNDRQIMIVNEYGRIAEKQWYWLGRQYSHLIMHEFVIMPNHVHGIIEIRESLAGTGRFVGTGNFVGTGRDLSLHTGRISEMKIKPLMQIIGAYKTSVAKQIHLLGNLEFSWQRSFHDHIIKDKAEFLSISEYILDNTSKWHEDVFYVRNTL